jgi:hypothetical protein
MRPAPFRLASILTVPVGGWARAGRLRETAPVPKGGSRADREAAVAASPTLHRPGRRPEYHPGRGRELAGLPAKPGRFGYRAGFGILGRSEGTVTVWEGAAAEAAWWRAPARREAADAGLATRAQGTARCPVVARIEPEEFLRRWRTMQPAGFVDPFFP